jgi:glycosyltransferase involved in cell wall biosynthesis
MLAAADATSCDVLVLGGNVRHAQLQRTLRAARRAGLPTLLWMHGLGRTRSPVAGWLRRRACAAASGAVAYSARVRVDLIAEGMDEHRVFVAPNGVDQEPVDRAIAAWTADPARLPAFRREQGLEGRELLLAIGRLEPDKRQDLLVEALAMLASRRPQLLAAVIGKGSAQPALLELAAARGVAERIRWLGAIYAEDAIAPWALSAALLVHPGAIGLTVFHAFGFGLPIVTSDDRLAHGPEIDAITPGVNGVTVPAGDAAALAEAIGELLDDAARRAAMAEAARAAVRGPEGFSLDGMVRGFREAFAAVSGNRPPPGT